MTLTLTAACNSAMQELGDLDSGEGLSAQQITDALGVAGAPGYAQRLIDSWSTDRLMAAHCQITTVTMTGASAYAVGSPAPAAVESAAINTSAGPTLPVGVVNAIQWEGIENRERISPEVRFLFYDRSGFLHVSPMPPSGTLEYTWWAALPQFVDATTPLAMDPGYARMFVLSLAMEMAAQFSSQPSESMVANYRQARDSIRTLNASIFGANPPAGAAAQAGAA